MRESRLRHGLLTKIYSKCVTFYIQLSYKMNITICCMNLIKKTNLSKLSKTLLSGIAVAVVLFVSSVSFAQYVSDTDHYDSLPDLGSSSANYLSESDSQKLGKAFIRQSRFQQPYVSDPELVDYINRLGQKLLAVSSDADKDYQFYLIDNNVINAFAVPGGHIALHTAILTKAQSESELASVIGHEISHVTQRHISRRIETSRYDSLIAFGTLLAAAAVGGSDTIPAAFSLANASIIDRQLTYSRSFESEADSLGIRLLSRAGFDPSAMPVFFKRLLDENRISELNSLEFLRSHPLTINRISESSQRVKAYPVAGEQDQSEFLLMQAKARASYATDKKQMRDFYEHEVNLGKNDLPTRYGYAMAMSKYHEYDQAREVIKELMLEFPDNKSVRLLMADNELESDNIEYGLTILKDLYEERRAANDYSVDIYYANALVLTDRNEEAIPILRAAISDNKEEPYNHILISRAYSEVGEEMQSFQSRGEFHYLRGNYEFAIQQFKRAERMADSDYQRARLKARIVDVEKEIEELKNL